MPVFVPVNPPRNPDECSAWLFEAITRLNRHATKATQATAAISRGENPDGSGEEIGVTDHGRLTGLADDDHTQYLLLAGRASGQIAFGGTAGLETLTLSSTEADAKGLIYFGEDHVTTAYNETDGLFGVGTVDPQARVHAVSTAGGGGVLQASSDVSATGVGGNSGAGGDPNPYATLWQCIQTADDYGSYIDSDGSSGGGTVVFGLTGTPSAAYSSWTVSFRARRLFGIAIPAGSTIQFRIHLDNGKSYLSDHFDITVLGDSWQNYTHEIAIIGAGSTSTTPGRFEVLIGLSASFKYPAITYLDIRPTGVGDPYEALIAQASGSSGANIMSVRGTTFSETFFRVLDTGQVNFDDAGVTRAYHRFDGKLYIEHPTTGGSYATQAMIRLEQADAATNGVAFLSCYDQNLASEVFAIGTDGAITTAAMNISDVGVGGTSIANFAPLSGVPWGGNFSLYIPDVSGTGSGTLVLDTTSGLSFAVNLLAGSRFISSTSSSGASFADSGNNNRRLRMILSGASANNHTFTLTNSGARNYGFGNLSGNVVIVGDDPPSVASGALGKVDLTGQTAAIGSTNLSSTPPAGFYEVQVVAICTTASGSGAPTLDVTLAWTDALGATTEKTINGLSLAATGRVHGATRMTVASGNIAYSTTINSASGSPQYAVYIRVVYLG